MAANKFLVAQLLQKAVISFDPDTSTLPMLRVVPVAIYVDGKSARRVGMLVAAEVRKLLAELGYTEIQLWGNFAGSFLQLNLCQSRVFEDGPTFAGKLEQFQAGLKKLPWGRFLAIAGSTATIVVAAGGVVALVSPATGAAIVATYPITTKAWLALLVGDKTKKVVSEFKSIFAESPAAKKALATTEETPHKASDLPPEVKPASPVETQRDIRVGKPYKVKLPNPPSKSN